LGVSTGRTARGRRKREPGGGVPIRPLTRSCCRRDCAWRRTGSAAVRVVTTRRGSGLPRGGLTGPEEARRAPARRTKTYTFTRVCGFFVRSDPNDANCTVRMCGQFGVNRRRVGTVDQTRFFLIRDVIVYSLIESANPSAGCFLAGVRLRRSFGRARERALFGSSIFGRRPRRGKHRGGLRGRSGFRPHFRCDFRKTGNRLVSESIRKYHLAVAKVSGFDRVFFQRAGRTAGRRRGEPSRDYRVDARRRAPARGVGHRCVRPARPAAPPGATERPSGRIPNEGALHAAGGFRL